MMHAKAVTVPDDPSSVRDMLQHAAYYFPRERARDFDRLRNNNSPLALRDLAANTSERSLMQCSAELNASGVRVALVDVTSADVATGPFCVIRAVSPDLQPIWYGYGLDRHPVQRLRNLAPSPQSAAMHPIW